MKITLIGDSIFDNKVYVGKDEQSTSEHLAGVVEQYDGTREPALCAVDGAITTGVHRQLETIPSDTTHLVLSVGGNDALGDIDILDMKASSSAAVFYELSQRVSAFKARYEKLLDAILEKDLPLTVCTVYYPRMENEMHQTLACAALASFNDAILVSAFKRGLPVIDLRLVCNEDEDYANPIEPSHQGGLKIAHAINRAVQNQEDEEFRSVIYTS